MSELLNRPSNDRIVGVGRNKNVEMDKIERYHWTAVDAPGEMQWLPKEILRIDHNYQRQLVRDRILKMASEWSWIACGTIIVAARLSDYMVMDGQHRVEAAKTRSDIEMLPCIVFRVKSIESEASGFLSTNTLRKAMRAIDRFKALVITGDSSALAVQKLIEISGRQLSKNTGPGALGCLSTLLLCQKKDGAALAKVWPVLVELCEGSALPQDVAAGMWWLQTRLPEGDSLASTRWRTRILSAGYDEVENAIAKAAAFYGSRNPAVCGTAIATLVNRGLRNKMLFRPMQSEGRSPARGVIGSTW